MTEASLQPTVTPGTPGAFETALNASPTASGGGIHLLDSLPIFNLLCVPGEIDPATIAELQAYCYGQRAFLIVDSSIGRYVCNSAKWSCRHQREQRHQFRFLFPLG